MSAAAKASKPAQRVALIAGASRGLGRGLVEELIKVQPAYSAIYAAMRTPQPAFFDAMSTPSTKVVAVPLDVADESSVSALAARIKSEVGAVDLLINNAALAKESFLDVSSLTQDSMAKVFAVNSTGPMLMAKHFHDLVKASEDKRFINITSVAGCLGHSIGGQGGGGFLPYKVSKAAMNMFTVALGGEWKKEGITLAAISPGGVATDMTASFVPKDRLTEEHGWLSPNKAAQKVVNIIHVLNPEQHAGKLINHRYLDEGDSEKGTFLMN